jgi:hypothetical protein
MRVLLLGAGPAGPAEQPHTTKIHRTVSPVLAGALSNTPIEHRHSLNEDAEKHPLFTRMQQFAALRRRCSCEYNLGLIQSYREIVIMADTSAA